MTILVTGATGTVGRHLVNHLRHSGQHVRALTRDPAKARTRLPADVEIAPGDLTAPDTLTPALDGVTALHLLTAAGDGLSPLQTGPEIMERAAKAGVRRVTVLWSGDPGPVEQAVESSGLEWTQLQPMEFMSNALEWSESIRTEGVAREFGDKPSAVIHEADIAAVAATALTEEGHAGRSYVLTGPEALTVPERVHAIARATGRDIRYEPLTESEARTRMRALGSPDEAVDFVVSWMANPPESAYTVVPTVEEVTGRPPRTFTQWSTEHAASFTP